MRKVTLVLYLVVLHLLLAVVLVNSDFSERVGRKFGRLNDVQAKILARQAVWAQTAPEGVVVFLGDSLTEGLPTTSITPLSVNFGIGGIQTADLQRNMPQYAPALQRASSVFLMIGTNDVLRGQFDGVSERIAAIVEFIPQGKPLVLATVPPSFRAVKTERVLELNGRIRGICVARPGCQVVDSWQVLGDSDGKPRREFFLEDGLHFSVLGYRRWIAQLQTPSRPVLE